MDRETWDLLVSMGLLDPRDERDFFQFTRDSNTMAADRMGSAFAGPGAFSPDAFDPDVEMEAVDAPGFRQLSMLAQGNDWRAILAEEILAGTDVTTAVAKVRGMADQGAITLPNWIDRNSGVEMNRPDWESILNTANSFQEMALTDPVGNYQDPETGQWFNQTVTPSPQAEWFREQGLPLPTERYDIDYFAPGLQQDLDAREAEFDRRIAGDRDRYGQLDDAQKSMMRMLLEDQERDAGQAMIGQRDAQRAQMAALLAPPPEAPVGAFDLSAEFPHLASAGPGGLPTGAEGIMQQARSERQAPDRYLAQGRTPGQGSFTIPGSRGGGLISRALDMAGGRTGPQPANQATADRTRRLAQQAHQRYTQGKRERDEFMVDRSAMLHDALGGREGALAYLQGQHGLRSPLQDVLQQRSAWRGW